MAKVLFNPVMEQIRGKIGDLVFRRTSGGMAVMRKTEPAETEPTPAQQQARERFRLAAAYAAAVAADPARVALYAPFVNRTRSLRVAAMTDYLTPPEVLAVETGAYDGAVGDPIVVRAVDDGAVVEVRLTLRDGAGAVLEQGVATAAAGLWTYAATTAVAAGTVVAVEAVATDRPGNTGRKTVTVTLP